MDAEAAPISSGETTRRLVQECWRLEEVAQHYREFLARYRPLARWLQQHTPDPETAFIARTLLIHDYRRVLLQDTALPDSLLPSAWPAEEALALTSRAYRALSVPSMTYITSALESESAVMPACEASFHQRFKSIE